MKGIPVALDIETTGLDFTTDTIRGIGIYAGEGNSEWFTDLNKARTAIEELKKQGAAFVMQNGKFDVKFLKHNGIDVECAFDTMIAAYLLKERPTTLSLDALASYYLGRPSWKGDVDFKTASLEDLGAYCLVDCEVTLQLHSVLNNKLHETGRYKFFERLMQAVKMLTGAEYTGMSVDWNALATLKKELEHEETKHLATLNEVCAVDIKEWQKQEIENKAKKCKDIAAARLRYSNRLPVFNWTSPKQVLWLLQSLQLDTLHWNAKKRIKEPSSCSDVLERHKATTGFCAPLLELRGTQKLKSALESYEELRSDFTNNIHGSFNVDVTRTGRLSSSNPNLQNIDKSKRVRGLFIPRPGHQFVIGDLAQIEVRMAAHYSQDPTLIAMFQRNEDFYGTIAVEILNADCTPNEVKKKFPELRNVAKVIGLSILYGVGPNKLREGIKVDTGIEFSASDSRKIINDYFKKFEGLSELRMRVDKKLTSTGFITTLFGRQLDISNEDIYMKGVNSLLQCSASDLMLFRQLEIDEAANKAGLNQNLTSLVHDELIRTVTPEHAEALKRICITTMERTDDIEFRVPLKLDAVIASSWADKE